MIKKSLLYIFILLILSSCITPSIEVVTIKEKTVNSNDIVLNKIHFDPVHIYTGDREQIKKLCITLAKKNGFNLKDTNSTISDTTHKLDIYLRDKIYTQGFNTIHSVAVSMEIVDINDAPIYKSYYLIEGDKPLQSLSMITDIFDQLLLKLYTYINSDQERIKKENQAE